MADYDLLIYEGFFFMGKHLAAGVPMVVIPYGSDQPVNGQRVKKLGVGWVLNMRSITRKKLKDMVLSTFADDAMKNLQKMFWIWSSGHRAIKAALWLLWHITINSRKANHPFLFSDTNTESVPPRLS